MKKIKFLLTLSIILLLSTFFTKATTFEQFIFEIPYDGNYTIEQILSHGPKTVVFEQDGYTVSVFNKQIVHLAKKGAEDKPFFTTNLKKNIDAIELIRDNKSNPVFIAIQSGKTKLSFIKKSKLKELQNFVN